jgi:arylsulfatase A-like enzyme
MGLVGYRTPNIDRIAKEGKLFADYYAGNSCTAGRSSFITGQTPKRTGMSKVGFPGAPIGLQARDVTIAQALKPLGYATGQFGKNHLGDRNEYLPSAVAMKRWPLAHVSSGFDLGANKREARRTDSVNYRATCR